MHKRSFLQGTLLAATLLSGLPLRAQTVDTAGVVRNYAELVSANYQDVLASALNLQKAIKAFTAAVLGGIGSVPGAMVGGLFLGVFESVGPSLFLDGLGIPAPNQLKDAIAFTMLVFVLIFRPSGILGERLATKKA